MVKTRKGYRCENNTGGGRQVRTLHQRVVLSATARWRMPRSRNLLEKRSILLDGFATKEWKTFPTVLVAAQLTALSIWSRWWHAAPLRRRDPRGRKGVQLLELPAGGKPCDFVIWRNIAGHLMTLSMKCARYAPMVSHPTRLRCSGENGSVYRRKLRLVTRQTKGHQGMKPGMKLAILLISCVAMWAA